MHESIKTLPSWDFQVLALLYQSINVAEWVVCVCLKPYGDWTAKWKYDPPHETSVLVHRTNERTSLPSLHNILQIYSKPLKKIICTHHSGIKRSAFTCGWDAWFSTPFWQRKVQLTQYEQHLLKGMAIIPEGIQRRDPYIVFQQSIVKVFYDLLFSRHIFHTLTGTHATTEQMVP